jgi:3-(3-hydroxy-phenyl)propionate hydroxylase
VPATLYDSVLNTPDGDDFGGRMVPGSVALDAPVQLADGSASWLLQQLGAGFTLMIYGVDLNAVLPCNVVHVQAKNDATTLEQAKVLIDIDGLIVKRYDMQAGTAYLLRPDQHVCARWRQLTPEKLQSALNLALSKNASKH